MRPGSRFKQRVESQSPIVLAPTTCTRATRGDLMTNTNQMDSESDTGAGDGSESAKSKTVVATSYVPRSQYEKWEKEADERNQSVSSFIASMVEVGVNEIQLEQESPSEIIKLRKRLQKVRLERDELQENIEAEERTDYQIGLGKIKELIIANPGIDRREIINHIAQNPVIFAEKYLDRLASSEFIQEGGRWYPPDSVRGEHED